MTQTTPPEVLVKKRARFVTVCRAVLNPLAFAWLVVLISIVAIQSLLLVRPLEREEKNGFSISLAQDNLQKIAARPHPLGSLEHRQVREFILDTLRKQGLEVEVQKQFVVESSKSRFIHTAATVENVIGRIKGVEGTDALLLAAHYDSTEFSPGASDNGAAVAQLLEVSRVISLRPKLKNDVIFLFTDGEEAGLLGASAFVKFHPWARHVSMVCNFDARGNKGPVLMFETSANSSALIREFRRVAALPVAYSLSAEIYKLMGNQTDFTVFKDRGVRGLNFASVMGGTHYHNRLDSIAKMDGALLARQGALALSLANHFGSTSLHFSDQPHCGFFNLGGPILIIYSYRSAWILIGTSALLLIAGIGWAMRKKRLSTGEVLMALGRLTIALIATFGAAKVLRNWIMQWNREWWIQNNGYTSLLFALGIICALFSINCTLVLSFPKRSSMRALAFSSAPFFIVLAIVAALRFPSCSYLFFVPTIAGSAVFLFCCWIDGRQSLSDEVVWLFCVALCIPVLLIYAPTLWLVFGAIGLNYIEWVALALVLVVFQLGPAIQLASRKQPWILPVGSATSAIVILGIGIHSARFDEQHPKSNSLFYVYSRDTQQGVWASSDRAPDPWTKQFLGTAPQKGPLTGFVPWRLGDFMFAKAERQPSLSMPTLTQVEDFSVENLRTLRVHVQPGSAAGHISIYLDFTGVLESGELAGKLIDQQHLTVNGTSQWILRYRRPPEGGFDVAFKFKAATPFKFHLLEVVPRAPESLVPGAVPRSSLQIASNTQLTDVVVVSSSYTF